jgi:RNA polymerase subunit RPABC4/transcription elongation factor Spt4
MELDLARLESCPTCNNPTSENAEACPSCGEPFEAGWADITIYIVYGVFIHVT